MHQLQRVRNLPKSILGVCRGKVISDDIFNYLKIISEADSFEAAWEALCLGAQKLELNVGGYGFGHIKEWDLTNANKPERRPTTEMIIIDNYSDEFSSFYSEGEFVDYDTTVAWAINNTNPALWSEVDRPVVSGELNGKCSELYHTTQDFGMKNGAIIPLRKRNDISIGGLVVFTDPELKTAQADRLLLERMGQMKTLAEAFHLYSPISAISEKRYNISKREKECLQYLCHGNSIKQIGYILGTHERTVQKQIASAKNKLNAHSMVQAVVKALAFELIDP